MVSVVIGLEEFAELEDAENRRVAVALADVGDDDEDDEFCGDAFL